MCVRMTEERECDAGALEEEGEGGLCKPTLHPFASATALVFSDLTARFLHGKCSTACISESASYDCGSFLKAVKCLMPVPAYGGLCVDIYIYMC